MHTCFSKCHDNSSTTSHSQVVINYIFLGPVQCLLWAVIKKRCTAAWIPLAGVYICHRFPTCTCLRSSQSMANKLALFLFLFWDELLILEQICTQVLWLWEFYSYLLTVIFLKEPMLLWHVVILPDMLFAHILYFVVHFSAKVLKNCSKIGFNFVDICIYIYTHTCVWPCVPNNKLPECQKCIFEN